jgi:hypothetical protein
MRMRLRKTIPSLTLIGNINGRCYLGETGANLCGWMSDEKWGEKCLPNMALIGTPVGNRLRHLAPAPSRAWVVNEVA